MIHMGYAHPTIILGILTCFVFTGGMTIAGPSGQDSSRLKLWSVLVEKCDRAALG